VAKQASAGAKGAAATKAHTASNAPRQLRPRAAEPRAPEHAAEGDGSAGQRRSSRKSTRAEHTHRWARPTPHTTMERHGAIANHEGMAGLRQPTAGWAHEPSAGWATIGPHDDIW